MNFSALVPSEKNPALAALGTFRVIGIDLGTTNSAVAEIVFSVGHQGEVKPSCLSVNQLTRHGPEFDTLVPSILALWEGKLFIGTGAKDLRALIGDYNLKKYTNIFWDCKNDIGVRRTYHKAPEKFRSAKQIGGHLLKFLMEAVPDDGVKNTTTVVTVPASFQGAQRQDTLAAAKLANIDLTPGALLDEPIAAFIDYISSHSQEHFVVQSEKSKLLAFDFGGGTCDVALFELGRSKPGARAAIEVATFAVSRYHRLGGGDIDRKIVTEILIPQCVKQNGLQPNDLTYKDKAKYLLPALLGCAEALKIGLCREMKRKQDLGYYTEEEHEKLVYKLSGIYPCNLRNGTILQLKSPTLSAIEFDNVLEPFLDRSLLNYNESEYFQTCSVFAPLEDVLKRVELDSDDIDYCLLVGGSSLIPQIDKAIENYFTYAKILRFDNVEATQTAVAHGAAWQALSLVVRGKGLVRPVTGSSIKINTQSGPVDLIKNQTELPFPVSGKWAKNEQLVVPETSLTEEVPLKVELHGDRNQILWNNTWKIRPVVSKGDSLILHYRMDANQVLHLRLSLKDWPEQEFESIVENPLSAIDNPSVERNRILELEEQLRSEVLSEREQQQIVIELVELEWELGHMEQALDYLIELNRTKPSSWILNRMGIIAGKLGDYDREEKFYRDAARISPRYSASLFNLAQSQDNQGILEESVQTIEEAIRREPASPYLIFKARLSDKLKQPKYVREELLERAFRDYGNLQSLNDFEFLWYERGANLAGDASKITDVEKERKRRREQGKIIERVEGVLPELKNELTKRTQ